MTRVADAVAQTLKAYGVDHFFQLTGGEPALWTALESAGIRMVPAHTESAAVYMADAFARMTGRPGLVYGQHGPGAANVAAGLADPYWALSPVVSLCSSVPLAERNRYGYQDLDQQKMFSAVTRWRSAVLRPADAPRLLRAALRMATANPSGPVHIDIPRDVFSAEVGPGEEIYAEAGGDRQSHSRVQPSAEAIERVVGALAASRRPVVLAGTGLITSEAWPELGSFTDAAGIPVATSPGGKGSISERHRLAVGVVGRYSSKFSNEIVGDADLVLAIGTRLGGLTTDTYRLVAPTAVVVHVDADPAVLGANYREAVSVHADAKAFLQALTDQMQAGGLSSHWPDWSAAVASRVGEGRAAIHGQGRFDEAVGELHPARVMDAINGILTGSEVIVSDTGYAAAWTGVLLALPVAGRGFIRAAGSLGWALPGAIGAALACPDKQVICVTGDGGVGYHIAELETAVRLGVPVLVVVLNNRRLAFEHHLLKHTQGRSLEAVTDFTDIDYASIATALGAVGRCITTADDLVAQLRRYLDAPVQAPTLLDVRIDREAVAPVRNYDAERAYS